MNRIRYGEKQFCESTVLDLDAEGHEDIVLENREMALYIDPADGGVIKEVDSRTVCQNLLNSLARRKEAYHRKILEKIARQQEAASSGNVQTIHDNAQAADPALKEHLSYDRYGRYGLIDHFLGRGTDIRSFSRCSYREAGDFVNATYDFEVNKKNKGVSVNMKREGKVDSSRIYLEKEITRPKKGSNFSVDYLIANRESGSIELLFAPEFNVTMPDCDSDQYTLVAAGDTVLGHLSDLVEEKRTGEVRIKDGRGTFSWHMSFSDDCILWHFPVKTVSQSEKAYELNYQSSALVPVFCFRLGPGEEKKIGLRFELE
jgi:alpha-amylase